MRAFEYARPGRLEEAARLLAEKPAESRPLAGGVDLLALMKDRVETPSRVVSLTGLRELAGIAADEATGLRLGALATIAEIAASPEVGRVAPDLAAAAARVGGPQIRNQGTLGGNLCQRPRCWYYRKGYGILATTRGRPMVPDGDNRYHAILGNHGPAYFVSPSTLAPLLIALGARARIAGHGGRRREIPLGDLYRIPEEEGESEIALEPGEILTEVFLPPLAAGGRAASYEVRQGEALDWALVTASVALEMTGDRVGSARLLLGQVAPIPWRAVEAESSLAGQVLKPEAAARAGELAVRGARPLSRNAYKVQLAQVAVKRALLAAAAAGEGA